MAALNAAGWLSATPILDFDPMKSQQQQLRYSAKSMDRLFSHWDNQIVKWEQAGDKASLANEHEVARRNRARALEILTCRKELEKALANNT